MQVKPSIGYNGGLSVYEIHDCRVMLRPLSPSLSIEKGDVLEITMSRAYLLVSAYMLDAHPAQHYTRFAMAYP